MMLYATLVLFLLTTSLSIASATPLRFLTWNLRYDSKPNSIPLSTTISSLPASLPSDENTTFYASSAEDPWSSRRISIFREIAFSSPDIFCIQEALVRQVKDLAELFPEYSWVGVGRDDGKEKGEFEAVFWRKDKLELGKGGGTGWDTFWLSETPEKPSKYPGAGSIRTATRVRLQLKEGGEGEGRTVTVLCTHWDDQSDAQRQLAASLIRHRVGHELERTGSPVFVLGDFNSRATGIESSSYLILTGAKQPVPINKTFQDKYRNKYSEQPTWGLSDVAQQTPPIGRSGHLATFTGFERWEMMDLKRIDFICAVGEGWKAIRYRVGETWYDYQGMSSDHRPVWGDVELE